VWGPNVWPLLIYSHTFGTRIWLPNTINPASELQELSDFVQVNIIAQKVISSHTGMFVFGRQILMPRVCEYESMCCTVTIHEPWFARVS
jgi:hypothetical protein